VERLEALKELALIFPQAQKWYSQSFVGSTFLHPNWDDDDEEGEEDGDDQLLSLLVDDDEH
jgi:hypothetical protein